jgi:hypothetical protein
MILIHIRTYHLTLAIYIYIYIFRTIKTNNNNESFFCKLLYGFNYKEFEGEIKKHKYSLLNTFNIL